MQSTLFDRHDQGKPDKAEIRPQGLPVKVAATYLGCSRWTVQRLLARGEISDYYIGAAHFIDVASLDRYLARQRAARPERDGG
jgi:excisionase family DNA binding protein